MTIDISISDFINYNPAVGVEYLHIVGLPGKGKTNQANNIAAYCLAKGEPLVIPGDRFCEWRHFLLFNKTCDVKVLIPEGEEIYYYPEGIKGKLPLLEVNYEKLKVMDHLDEERKKPTVLAIYDAFLPIAERVALWVSIAKQLLNRITFLDRAITLLFNEAGIYFPQMAKGKHWRAVDDFSNILVDFRKGLVRPIFVSQLKTEVEATIREKCLYKIYRQGAATRREPEPLRKAIPYTELGEYHLQVGGLYVRYNEVEEFKEMKNVIKMIPTGSMIDNSPPSVTETD